MTWGDRDLQGVWNDATNTPLESPNGLAGKGVLADEEAAEFQQQPADNLSRDEIIWKQTETAGTVMRLID